MCRCGHPAASPVLLSWPDSAGPHSFLTCPQVTLSSHRGIGSLREVFLHHLHPAEGAGFQEVEGAAPGAGRRDELGQEVSHFSVAGSVLPVLNFI